MPTSVVSGRSIAVFASPFHRRLTLDATTDAVGREESRSAVPSTAPRWAWVLAAVLVGLSVIKFGALGRFLEWDEAVFWSQSGDYAGNGAPPLFMAASREIGPAVIIGGLRSLGLGLAAVRACWAAMTVGLLFAAAWRLERHLGRWVGVTTAALFGTSWLFSAYVGSFYGAGPAAVLGLLLLALYLDFRVFQPSIARGVLLGCVVALALWMRTFETGVVLAVISIHSLTIKPGVVWRHRIPGLAAAIATVLVLFVVPWAVDSSSRYGGVMNRIELASNQDFALSFDVRLGSYLDYVGGGQQARNIFTSIPGWPGTIMAVALGLVVILGISALGRRSIRQNAAWALVAVLALATLSFYLFIAEQLRDRYLLFGLAFLFAAGSAMLVAAFGSPRRKVLGLLAAVVAALWMTAQWAVAAPYQEARDVAGGQLEIFGGLLDDVVEGPCRGVARYGAAQWQIATGCSFRSASNPDLAEALAAEMVKDGSTVVVVWPENVADDLDLGEDWQTVKFVRTVERSDLVFVSGASLDSIELALFGDHPWLDER